MKKQVKKTGLVTTLRELAALTAAHRSIVVPTHDAYKKPTPAAWMMNLSGLTLLTLFVSGMYVYEKKPKVAKRYGWKP